MLEGRDAVSLDGVSRVSIAHICLLVFVLYVRRP